MFLVIKYVRCYLHDAVIVSRKWEINELCVKTIRIRIYELALGTRADDEDDRHEGYGMRSDQGQVQSESKARSVPRCGMRLGNEERGCGMGLWSLMT